MSPLYDFTHGLSDALEGVTHSLCTLEFADHRPLYDWLIEHADAPSTPEQTEFARLQLEHTVVSKRKLAALVDQGKVRGWDDPRMPTLRGLRRRGYPPEAIRTFCERIGVTRNDAWIDFEQFEVCARDHLNVHAERRMAVLEPLKVSLTNLPPEGPHTVELPNHPQDPARGVRHTAISDTLWIEQDDFSDDPPPKWKRLMPGGEVRLRGAWVIRCDEVVRGDAGEVIELKCSIDPDTLGKKPEGRKVKGVIHWVDAASALDAEVRVYDRLFTVPNPAAETDMMAVLNPASLTVHAGAKLEAALADAPHESVFQFERLGYFSVDPDTDGTRRVFNRTVALRDTWSS
ncbi:MAG: glutamate--tRNA ligase family protein [Pseudomonadota bacterium]